MHLPRSFRALLCGPVFVLALAPASVRAQGEADSASKSARPAAVVTRGDLGWLALTVGVATLAQRADLSVRREVRGTASQANNSLAALADLGNAWGQPSVVLIGAGLWGGGLLAKNETAATVGLRAIEAITVSSIVTKVIKGSFGRARPRVSPNDAWDVEFGRGFRSSGGDYESFPSGHSTAAFAFAAAVTSELAHRAPRHALLVGVTTYSLALGTAYARLYRDAHWLSDVTMGAGIGVVGGLAVTRWHRTRPGNRPDAILLRPVLGPSSTGSTNLGVSLTWR